MKVFISWSGNKSHRVALLFREWLPSVIQSVVPYVSSEDIDKGARWSTDIAKELEDSTFGILCVTKENLNAPWLSFEAGALSKTMDKSFVTPFLFDIKRSEVNGPILQFQSTIFEKEDIKKLLSTINKACGDEGLSESMLEKAFEVWYPSLAKELSDIHDISDEDEHAGEPDSETHMSSIIEELLELSRDNQKLLRNPDTKLNDSIESIKQRLDYTLSLFERNSEMEERRIARRNKAMYLDELLHVVLPDCNKKYAFLILLSLVQDDFPWIYNMGKELMDILNSRTNTSKKITAINDFRRLMMFSLDHPAMRESISRRKDSALVLKEVPYALSEILFTMEKEIEQRE